MSEPLAASRPGAGSGCATASRAAATDAWRACAALCSERSTVCLTQAGHHAAGFRALVDLDAVALPPRSLAAWLRIVAWHLGQVNWLPLREISLSPVGSGVAYATCDDVLTCREFPCAAISDPTTARASWWRPRRLQRDADRPGCTPPRRLSLVRQTRPLLVAEGGGVRPGSRRRVRAACPSRLGAPVSHRVAGGRETCVCDLAELVDMTPSALSQRTTTAAHGRRRHEPRRLCPPLPPAGRPEGVGQGLAPPPALAAVGAWFAIALRIAMCGFDESCGNCARSGQRKRRDPPARSVGAESRQQRSHPGRGTAAPRVDRAGRMVRARVGAIRPAGAVYRPAGPGVKPPLGAARRGRP